MPETALQGHRVDASLDGMSKAEILAELPKLTPAERQEVRLQLARLDGEEWFDAGEPLTDAEKALLDARLAAYAKTRKPEVPGKKWKPVFAPGSKHEPPAHHPPGSRGGPHRSRALVVAQISNLL